MSEMNRSIGASSPQSMGGGRGRLPLGVQTFRKVRESGGYYVDKTAYAYRMISEGECYFLSPPSAFRQESVRGHAQGAVRGE